MRGMCVSSGIGWGIAILQVSLHCSLHWVMGTIIYSLFVTILFPHRSILLFTHTRCLLTWRGRRHYTNTSILFIRTTSSFCFFDLSMDLTNS